MCSAFHKELSYLLLQPLLYFEKWSLQTEVNKGELLICGYDTKKSIVTSSPSGLFVGGFISEQHLMSYQGGYCLVIVHTDGDVYALSN